MTSLRVSVTGDERLIRKMSNRLYAGPVSRFFRAAGQTIKGRAQDLVPRFDGLLANSITVETDTATPMRFVRVGTNAEYAAAVEKGSRPHFPPVAAIAPWAEAKGLSPWAVAFGISRKGTRPHPFLGPALDASKPDILTLLYRMGREIEAQTA